MHPSDAYGIFYTTKKLLLISFNGCDSIKQFDDAISVL